MTVYSVLLFGITKDLLKEKTIQVKVDQPITASELLKHLKISYPELAKLPSLRIAAEHHFPEESFLLLPAMEIALIPPVSGG